MAQCSERNILFVLTGPTGVGKTQLSLSLARLWRCPILNCDSRQIYRELPIGTAAPTKEEQKAVKHFFVATHSLGQTYSAGEYAADAKQVLNRLLPKESIAEPFAILSGGSMMYMDAVCYGLDDIPHASPELREQIQQQYNRYGLQWLQQEAARLDPDYYQTMADRQNPQRLIHCIEVTLQSSRPYSTFLTGRRVQEQWKILKVALSLPREALYDRINRRVDEMVDNGMEEEAFSAYQSVRHLKSVPNSLQTVGYNEWISYFTGECTRSQAIELIKQNTRRYAKRQLTWLRRQTDTVWIDRQQSDDQIITTIQQLIR